MLDAKIKQQLNVFTVDVEDWYHLLDVSNAPNKQIWESMDCRVDSNTHKLLKVLEQNKVKATFFVLGWVAERHKELIKDIDCLGHEIASHGYSHFLYHKSTRKNIKEDLIKSKIILEDIIGKQVYGFRAPGFSTKKENMWVFEEIKKAGYEYDSSVFPAIRTHGGNVLMPVVPFRFSSGLVEFPVGVLDLGIIKIPFGGGGYFRLYPKVLFKYLANNYLKKTGYPFVFYLHPREIDPGQPRIKMNLKRKFQTYVNLGSSLNKLDQLFKEVRFGSLLKENLDKYATEIGEYIFSKGCMQNKNTE